MTVILTIILAIFGVVIVNKVIEVTTDDFIDSLTDEEVNILYDIINKE